MSTTWKKWGLQPWRSQTLRFSTDPELETKIRDIVGLYLNPPEAAIVLCVDEKSQIQALDRTAPILPIRPGIPEKQTHDYVRRCEPFVWTKPADDIVKKATKVTRLQWRDTSRAGRW